MCPVVVTVSAQTWVLFHFSWISPSHQNTLVMYDGEKKCVFAQLCANRCRLPPPNRQAKRLLNEIVEQCRYGPGFHCDMDGNGSIQQILIPANKVGLVIGKKGETIKQLQVWDVTAFTVKVTTYLTSPSTLLSTMWMSCKLTAPQLNPVFIHLPLEMTECTPTIRSAAFVRTLLK